MLIPCERLADQRLHIWRKLYVHGSHAVFHESAESLDHSVLFNKLGEESIDERPELDEQVCKRVDLLVDSTWESIKTLEKVC